MTRTSFTAFLALAVAGIVAVVWSRFRRDRSTFDLWTARAASRSAEPTVDRHEAIRLVAEREAAGPVQVLNPPRPADHPVMPHDGIKRQPSRSMTIGLAAWVIAVVVAFVAQRELTPVGAVIPAVGLFALASIIFVFGAVLINRSTPLPDLSIGVETDAVAKRSRHPVWRLALGGGLVVAGVVLAGTSAFIVVTRDSSRLAIPLWILALVVETVGLCLWTTFPWRVRRSRAEVVELLGVLAIIGLAFAYRFPGLQQIPADVHGDEAAVGIAARALLSGETTDIFGLGWAELPQLSFVASALSMRVFGDNLFGLRLASVIQGCLSVGLLYAVTKRLFSVRVAALAAIILAVSQMAIHFSRIGTIYIQGLFVGLLLFYFLLRGLSTHHSVDFLFAGFSAGLALSVYYAARFAIIVLVVYCLHRAIGERDFLRRQWRGLAVLVLGVCIFFIPQAVHYMQDPMSFLSRTSGVFVLSQDNLNHEYDAYKVHSTVDVLRIQAIRSLGAFNLLGETSEQYGQVGPLLDFWSGALFVLGMVLVTLRARQSRYFLVASWFWLTLVLSSMLTVDALFSPHIVGLLGILAILPALVVDVGWRGLVGRFGTWGMRIGVALAVVFVAVVAAANYQDYFVVHATTMEQPNFFTVLSRYLQEKNGAFRVYLISDADTSLRYDTAHFLVPNVDGVDVRGLPLRLPLDRIPATKGITFVDRSHSDPRFLAIEAVYPRGVEEAHRSSNDYIEFYSYEVTNADLAAADPSAYRDHAPIPAVNLDTLKPQ